MGFLTRGLEVHLTDHVGTRWALSKELRYAGKRDWWTVPRGYITDFASVPRVFRWLLNVSSTYVRAAILHDWFCSFAIQAGIISAVDADGVFRRVCREEGVGWLTRWTLWCAVRWGALLNPKRRAGWMSTFWPVIGLTLLLLPVVVVSLPGVIIGLLVWGLYGVLGGLIQSVA